PRARGQDPHARGTPRWRGGATVLGSHHGDPRGRAAARSASGPPRCGRLAAGGALLGDARLPGAPLARPANEGHWIDELARALAAIHAVPASALAPDYPRAPDPAAVVETRLERSSPKTHEALWREVAEALRAAAPN